MKISKAEAIDFVILVFRWYLAFYMIDYGWSKLYGEQFGLHDPHLAEKPMKDLDNFYVAWYLFGQSKTFNIAVGLSQIIGSILILIPRTKLIGALVLLPILANIFLIDVCFTTGIFGFNLPIRLAGMIFADLAILYHSREEVVAAWRSLTSPKVLGAKYRWWIYPLVLVLGFLSDFIFGLISLPLKLLLQHLYNWMHR
jgi:uncharacterized membrane protein YphA (DoxX/SURF4 family)